MTEETSSFISAHLGDDVHSLALKSALYPNVDFPYALKQIEGRQKALIKLPSWAAIDAILYPRHLSVEQCSSERTAIYKANLANTLINKRESMVDLTGGFGVDFTYIGRGFSDITYVEQQKELCEICKNNFPLLGLERADVVCGDGVEYLQTMEPVDLIFIDPARRDANGGKVVAINDCQPNILEIEDLLLSKSKYTIVKLSPMLDWHKAVETLHSVVDVHIISINNECKELLLVLSKNAKYQPHIYCVNDDSVFKFSPTEEITLSKALDINVGQYLYEPDASVMKSGCFNLLTSHFNVTAIGVNSHLFVSDENIDGFPGRRFKIESLFTLNKKELKNNIRDLKYANITVRNFPISVAELRKRLKLIDGGNVYIFATTLGDKQHILLKCSKI